MAELNTTESTEILETPTVPTAPTESIPAELPKSDSTELLKMKAALDKAAKEAADYKKQLRARQSEEETRAQDEAERKAAMETELETLRKKFAVADHAKRVISIVEDETMANSIADSLYGASDADSVIDGLAKAWTAREKKLRLEFGKVPAPSAGDSSVSISKQDFENMSYAQRMEIASKHPDIYKKLTE